MLLFAFAAKRHQKNTDNIENRLKSVENTGGTSSCLPVFQYRHPYMKIHLKLRDYQSSKDTNKQHPSLFRRTLVQLVD